MPGDSSIQQDKELRAILITLVEKYSNMVRSKKLFRDRDYILSKDSQGFRYVEDALKEIEARDKELARKAEYAARFDELLTAAHNSDDILNNGYYESRCYELRGLQQQSNGEKQ